MLGKSLWGWITIKNIIRLHATRLGWKWGRERRKRNVSPRNITFMNCRNYLEAQKKSTEYTAFLSQKKKKKHPKTSRNLPPLCRQFPKSTWQWKTFYIAPNLPAVRSRWLLPTSQHCRSKCPMGIVLHYRSNLCHQCTDRSGGKMKSVYIVSVG